MRKNCLIISEVFYPEEFLINEFASYLSEKGYNVEVLARNPSYPFGKSYPGFQNKIFQQTFLNKIKIHRIFFCPGYKKSFLVKIINYFCFIVFGSIAGLILGRRSDVVFVYQTGPLTMAIPGVLIKKIYRRKLVIWTQDLWPETIYAYGIKKTKFLDSILGVFVSWIYKNCSHVIVTSEGFIKKLKQYYKNKSISIVHNWVPFARHNDKDIELNLPAGFNFLFAGNIGSLQNLDKVILGFQLFQKDEPNCNLNIVGDGSRLDEIKALVNTRNINNVFFYGRVSQSIVPEYLNQANALIISLSKTVIGEITIPAKFPMYLSFKKPIFGIIKGDIQRLIEENKIGITSDPDDTVNISHQFKAIYNLNQAELESISANCQTLLEREFSSDKSMHSLEQIIFFDK